MSPSKVVISPSLIIGILLHGLQLIGFSSLMREKNISRKWSIPDYPDFFMISFPFSLIVAFFRREEGEALVLFFLLSWLSYNQRPNLDGLPSHSISNPIAARKSSVVCKILMDGKLSVLVLVWWDSCQAFFFFLLPSSFLLLQECVPAFNLMDLSVLRSRGIDAA